MSESVSVAAPHGPPLEPYAHVSYRPEIDGLRAVSVLAVLLFHADFGCPGGYVGVDVFFVISGFLITSLILKELAGGKFSLAQFWERRVRRIFPALAVVLVATLAVGYWLLLPEDLEALGKSAAAQVLAMGDLVNRLAAEQGIGGYIAAFGGGPPVPGAWLPFKDPGGVRSLKWGDYVLNFIKEREIKNVIVTARWSVYVDGYNETEMEHEEDRGVNREAILLGDAFSESLSPAEARAVFRRQMRGLVDRLTAQGVRTWLIEQVPEPREAIARGHLFATLHPHLVNPPAEPTTRTEHVRRQANVHEIFSGLVGPGVQVIDPAPFCFRGSDASTTILDGRPCYRDDDHLSKFGAERLLRPMLEPIMKEIAAQCRTYETGAVQQP